MRKSTPPPMVGPSKDDAQGALLWQAMELVRPWIERFDKSLDPDDVDDIVAKILRDAADPEGDTALHLQNLPGTIAVAKRAAMQFCVDRNRRAASLAAASHDYSVHVFTAHDEQTDLHQLVVVAELLAVIDKALAPLRAVEREAYLRIEREGLSYEEAAASLNKTIAQTHHGLLQARRAVAAAVTEYGREPVVRPPNTIRKGHSDA